MDTQNHAGIVPKSRTRRTILKWSATGALVGVAAFGGLRLPGFGMTPAFAADLGAGDIGILNYAYSLEQLEAAFYSKVIETTYADITEAETALLTDIRDHEIAHRDFLKTALAADAIPDLEVDFSAVDFGDRTSVLTTAQTFEDIGVSAYNGAGQLLTNPEYLLAAGRIVSIEARHSAAIRILVSPDSVAFAGPDVVDKNGLDVVRAPAEVLALADPFIVTEVTAMNL